MCGSWRQMKEYIIERHGIKMLHPTADELCGGKYNRYVVVTATAKCARLVTDEYCRSREHAERAIASTETDKSFASMINREIRDEKAVKCAIKRLSDGEYKIIDSTVPKEDK